VAGVGSGCAGGRHGVSVGGRVATSRCLDALRSGRRRPPVTAPPAGLEPPEPTRFGERVMPNPMKGSR